MHTALVILQYVCLAAAGSAAVYWGIVTWHIADTVRKVPSLRDGLKEGAAGGGATESEGRPSVCVVVPAHNEEASIGLLASRLLAQDHPRMRVVFALDRCTDATERIVREATAGDERFSVVTIDSCPPEWVGKVHALHHAVTHAAAAREADILLFLDADTIPEPACVRAGVNLLGGRGLRMLSVLSTMTSDRWFERVVQPAAGMELMRQYPLVRSNDPSKSRPFANGQFIMVRREAYESIGGHAAVKDEVLEDVWLARHLARKGHACGFVFSGDLLGCRMYDRWEKFKKGWLRIFGECASRKPGRLRRGAASVRVVGTALPVLSFVGLCLAASGLVPEVRLVAAAVCTAGLAVWAGAIGWTYRLGRAPLWCVPAAPVGAWLVGSLMNQAARNYERGRPVVWGGREYRREGR